MEFSDMEGYESASDESDTGSPPVYVLDTCTHDSTSATTHSTKLGRVSDAQKEPYVEVQCNSETSTRITFSPMKSPGNNNFTYRVKVVNPERKSEFTMDRLSDTSRFQSLVELKQSLTDHLKFPVETLGYIEPGHGLRGKQQWLNRESDLNDMYASAKHRGEVTIWCFRPSEKATRKRSHSKDAEVNQMPAKAKRDSCSKAIDEVEDIICKLRKLHDRKYTTEQLSCWAHNIMYRMGKHSSLDDPPSLPFFTGCRKKPGQTNEEGTLSVTRVAANQTTVSPHKKVQMRGESSKQLAEWHSLLKQGIVTQEQYDEIQGVVLKDMKENFV